MWRSLTLRVAALGPAGAALLTVAVLMGGLLVGYEPIGGDPDRIFRPIKTELARALREGRTPYWSDRMGLGVPLVAESHVAAFYPPNRVIYRVLDVSTGYRLAMWGHYLALAGATFAYARRIGVEPWGAAVAAVSFTFCGFQTIHSSHEWAYQTLPYLPLCLLAADHYAETGRARWLAWLTLGWGAQITIGHFQVQMWTGGLALLTGSWRILADRRPFSRIFGLTAGLIGGALIASVQLVPSWELAGLVGQTRRSFYELAYYSYPPAHWAEVAVPGLFRGIRGGPEAGYWFGEQTTGFEACLFVGTLPLILAFIGLVGGGRGLSPWRLIVPAALALATMPRWWPRGYEAILLAPGLGYFRCPARYTAVASFGLALLAGRGLDRAVSRARFGIGLALAVVFGLSALFWAAALPSLSLAFRPCLDDAGLAARVGLAAVSWAFAIGVVLLVRRTSRVPQWLALAFTAAELGAFYHLGGTTQWGWSIPVPGSSPVLAWLESSREVRRVGGDLDNLPLRAGRSTASFYSGFPLPPPNPLLQAVQKREQLTREGAVVWLRRFGVTHLVGRDLPEVSGGSVAFRSRDAVLDRLVRSDLTPARGRGWEVIRLPEPLPEVSVATRVRVASDRESMLVRLASTVSSEEAWYVGVDPWGPSPPRATTARVVRWEGLSGEVDHDGACDLVLSRAFYPGWRYRVGDGPEIPCEAADGGLLASRVSGGGRSRVTFRFEPNGLMAARSVSACALLACLVTLAAGPLRSVRSLVRVEDRLPAHGPPTL